MGISSLLRGCPHSGHHTVGDEKGTTSPIKPVPEGRNQRLREAHLRDSCREPCHPRRPRLALPRFAPGASSPPPAEDRGCYTGEDREHGEGAEHLLGKRQPRL